MRRLVVCLIYTALTAWFFASYYIDVRGAPPDTIVDATPALYLLALAGLVAGLLIGRWWVLALPLIAFPVAALMLVTGALDDRYSEVAADRGGVSGIDWFGIAALVCAFAVPAAAVGAGMRALGDLPTLRR
jgi:hypothetical protein